MHIIDNDDLINDFTVIEKKFWQQAEQWRKMIEDLYNEDPYT